MPVVVGWTPFVVRCARCAVVVNDRPLCSLDLCVIHSWFNTHRFGMPRGGGWYPFAATRVVWRRR